MQVGYIGLGIMGAAMAANLRRAGFDVTVWNRTASKAEPLRLLGATVASSIAELAKHIDVICINVRDTPDVAAVLFGDDGTGGIAANAKRGTIVIDHSTIRPDSTRDFAGRLAQQGITLLDAPVSGGDVGAKNGTLSIMVGGNPAVFERCLPIFKAVGKNIVHVGPSGAGQACKACNQIALFAALAGVCEAFAFGTQQGLDLRKMIEVVSAGAGGSWQLANIGPKILARDLAPAFQIDLALKDLGIVADACATTGLKLEAIDVARQYLQRVADAGGAGLGTQAMIKVFDANAVTDGHR